MKKRKKRIVIVSVAASVLLAAAVCCEYSLRVVCYRCAVEHIQAENPVVSQLCDGTFRGKCDVDLICAQVEISISDGRIS